MSYCTEIFKTLSDMFHVNFLLPELAQFGTVIGTALVALGGEGN
jgi:hypothetical protein